MQMTPCELLCSQHPECWDPGQSCLEQCQSLYADGCEQETDAFLLCFLGVLGPGCEFPEDACFNEEQAYNQCLSSSDCQTDFCDEFQDGCDCFGECFGTPLQEQCFFTFGPDGGPPPPPVSCDCFVNGEFLGSCQLDELVCDLDAGCCKFFFLEG